MISPDACILAMATLTLLLLASYCIAGLNSNEFQVVSELDSTSEEGGSHKEVHSDHLAKRQTQCVVFYLREPPTSLQCNPQSFKTLTLCCQFLLNIVVNSPLQLEIGWYFSLNGVDAELVQASRFVVQTSLSAFKNKLVVRTLNSVYHKRVFCTAF